MSIHPLGAANARECPERLNLRLSLVGGFRCEREGRPHPVGLDGRRLLALLAMRGPTHRRIVAGELWPESPENRAAGCLRTSLWRLRRAGIVLAEHRHEWLSLPDAVVVDIIQFSRWSATLARPDLLADGELEASRVPCGDILPEWSEPWLVMERERLHQLRLRALETLAEELTRRGRASAGVEAARAAVEIDPLRESSTRLLIEAHLRQGEVGEAVRRLELFSRLLHDELGVQPSPGLRALVDSAVRRGVRCRHRMDASRRIGIAIVRT